MHGRSQPPAGRDQLPEFTAALAGYQWDVALLQEVPPWWPRELGTALDAEHRAVLTSRNSLLGLRRAIAIRWPDVIKSNGGGANAILARNDRIVADRELELCRLPERRWLHAALLACGIWIANLHGSADGAGAARDSARAAATAIGWAAAQPLVFGGDLNLRNPVFDGLQHVAARDVDHVFIANGLHATGDVDVLERGTLSDHPPLAVTVERPD
jgi:endonuclease/exonuclease/phosphatase family metal-dependent hydrolase